MMGMYLWLRYNGIDPLIAFLGAIAFGCSGSLSFRLKHFNNIHVLAWAPVCMLCIQTAWTKRSLLQFIILSIVWLMQLLAGHPHMFCICQLLCWSFVILLAVKEWIALHATWKVKFYRVALMFGSFALSLLTALILGTLQLYPAFELLHHSNREIASNFMDINANSLTVKHLLCWLYPFVNGNPAGHFCRADDTGYNLFAEATPYIGIMPLCLSCCSFAGKRRALALSVLLISLILIWIALGPKAGFYMVLWHSVPYFASFRVPSRIVAPIGCCLALLAGLGTQNVYDYIVKRCNEAKARVFIGAVIIITIADFSHINWLFQSYLSDEWLQNPPGATIIDKTSGRVLAPLYVMSWKAQMRQNNYNHREQICYAHRDQLGSELAAIWGVSSPDDYVAYHSGFVLNHSYRLQIVSALKLYSFWMTGQSSEPELVRQFFDYYRMQNVAHVILPHRISGEIVNEFFSTPIEVAEPKYPEISVCVYPLKNTLPRVRLISALTDKCPAEILDIDSYWTDSSGESLYEADRFGSHDIGLANIIAETPNTLTIKTKCDRVGHLFIANTYSPNWQAFIDDSAVPHQVQRTNYAFQSVPVPAGEHTVVLKYTCPAFWKGLWISLGGLAALLLTAFIGYQCRWR
ncbi:MAG: YfhO family protein [bacterium]|nr:YfhO family protein [bacterium]